MLRDFRMNRDLVIIENSYINIDVDINEMFEKGYTSKKEKSNDHGLGLWNVRRMLNKSKNLNLFTTKGKLFSQQLEIYSNKDENTKMIKYYAIIMQYKTKKFQHSKQILCRGDFNRPMI